MIVTDISVSYESMKISNSCLKITMFFKINKNACLLKTKELLDIVIYQIIALLNKNL